MTKERAGPVVGPAAPGAAGRSSHDRTRPRLAVPRDGAGQRPSFAEGASRVPHGAMWVPHGATPMAPKIKEGVAPWRCLRRWRLRRLVVVKCHFRCHLVPRASDHSPPAWHLGGHYLAQVRI